MCRMIGATSTPPATSSVISSAVNGTAGARHLGAAGLDRVDVLIRRERPAPRHVAVADRLPVLFEVGLERQREVETRQPQPDAGVRRENPGRPAAGELELLVDGDAAERRVPAAELDDPEAFGILVARGRREP